jgi:hypothetical protein
MWLRDSSGIVSHHAGWAILGPAPVVLGAMLCAPHDMSTLFGWEQDRIIPTVTYGGYSERIIHDLHLRL